MKIQRFCCENECLNIMCQFKDKCEFLGLVIHSFISNQVLLCLMAMHNMLKLARRHRSNNNGKFLNSNSS